jgi:peptidoglycan lytic transglycosylase D
MIRFTLIIFFIISIIPLYSQDTTGQGTDAKPDDLENQMIIEAIDSLTNLLYHSEAFNFDTSFTSKFKKDEIPVYSDSVYEYRLAQLNSPIDLTYNEIVRKYIDMYLVYKRGQVAKMVGLSKLYFPTFEQILDKHNLPLEFKYLPIIESALNPHARSRVGATGLWQFMYPTGKLYQLNINSYLDERRDPELSTEAAARFLSDLFDLYGDWSLALAAYNCGPGNVNKAIRRSGGKTTYWGIRDYLPRETRGYVPAFIAATYMMNYYEDHNIIPLSPEIDLSTLDTVMIHKEVDLKTLAAFIDIDEEELSFYNPSLKRNKIPTTNNGYALKIPYDKIALYDANKDSIFMASNAMPSKPVNSSPQFTTAKTYTKASSSNRSKSKTKHHYTTYVPDIQNKTKLIYTVKSGDNLGFIAEWYNIKSRDLKYWNNINGSRIYVGQKLKVYVKNDKVSQYKNIDNLSFDQKQQIEAKRKNTVYESSTASANTSNQNTNLQKKYIHYTIQSGDTLWDLTKKYPKNTIEDLKRVNNLTDMSILKPGYIIKIAI